MKISEHIERQFPFFVRTDNPQFVQFLEAYYEFLEANDYTPSKIQSWADIDTTLAAFKQYLYKTFLHNFPPNILTDKDLVLKHAQEFYRTKGSEKSVEFLLRILFNKDVKFYFPKQDILRVSDGKWYVQKSLIVDNILVDSVAQDTLPTSFASVRITGQTSRATASVEKTNTFYSGAILNELIIFNIVGSFVQGENITATASDGTTLQATIIESEIISVIVDEPGTGYHIGDRAILVSSNGTGGNVVVSQVTTGNVASLSIVKGGSGYQNGNFILFVSDSGSGANAVINVAPTGIIHPNTYNIYWQTFAGEANTPLGNDVYSTINANAHNVANLPLSQVLSYWQYSNTGPANTVIVINPGADYTETPAMSVLANTVIQSLGILGRMNIVSPGSNYAVHDVISVINPPGSYGVGAQAEVSNVNANGAITAVSWVAQTGFQAGGEDYQQFNLPTTSIASANGTNGVVEIVETLGFGGQFSIFNSGLGSIVRLTVLNPGSGYDANTTVDLTQSGDGTAKANVTVVAGVKTYPGRWLNDDGHISSFNFLENRDYYQNYSYVLRINESFKDFADYLKRLTHPAGMKVFSEYLIDTDVVALSSNTENFVVGYTYTDNVNNIANISSNNTVIFTATYDNLSRTFVRKSGNVTISNASMNIVNAGKGYTSNTYLLSNTGTFLLATLNANGSIIGFSSNGSGLDNIAMYKGVHWSNGSIKYLKGNTANIQLVQASGNTIINSVNTSSAIIILNDTYTLPNTGNITVYVSHSS